MGDSAPIGNLDNGAASGADYAAAKSARSLTRGRRTLLVDDLARRVFAGAATARDGEVRLDLAKRFCAAIDDFADLAIADGSADANVHRRTRRGCWIG